MSKKTYNLIVGILGGVSAILTAIVSYIQPENTPAIIAAVGIVNTAAVEVCSLFLDKEAVLLEEFDDLELDDK